MVLFANYLCVCVWAIMQNIPTDLWTIVCTQVTLLKTQMNMKQLTKQLNKTIIIKTINSKSFSRFSGRKSAKKQKLLDDTIIKKFPDLRKFEADDSSVSNLSDNKKLKVIVTQNNMKYGSMRELDPYVLILRTNAIAFVELSQFKNLRMLQIAMPTKYEQFNDCNLLESISVKFGNNISTLSSLVNLKTVEIESLNTLKKDWNKGLKIIILRLTNCPSWYLDNNFHLKRLVLKRERGDFVEIIDLSKMNLYELYIKGNYNFGDLNHMSNLEKLTVKKNVHFTRDHIKKITLTYLRIKKCIFFEGLPKKKNMLFLKVDKAVLIRKKPQILKTHKSQYAVYQDTPLVDGKMKICLIVIVI